MTYLYHSRGGKARMPAHECAAHAGAGVLPGLVTYKSIVRYGRIAVGGVLSCIGAHEAGGDGGLQYDVSVYSITPSKVICSCHTKMTFRPSITCLAEGGLLPLCWLSLF